MAGAHGVARQLTWWWQEGTEDKDCLSRIPHSDLHPPTRTHTTAQNSTTTGYQDFSAGAVGTFHTITASFFGLAKI
jgi:hypothetical protein